MSEQIVTILKRKIDDLAAYGEIDAETRLNVLKEELQYHVLNFIYHHTEYSCWTMYGGSALRICHDLDRMSVDLDFEVDHKVTNDFLDELKREAEKHFSSIYGVNPDFLIVTRTNNRGLVLKFRVGRELVVGYASEWVHIKIDLNYFPTSKKVVTERMPKNHGQLSFVIKTYNLSALMASKIAAIFLRGTRGVGAAIYGEKGRDIYDLLWYMNKKIVPDLDYLKAKDVKEAKDLRTLFDTLTIKMNSVNKENLKHDLSPLFVNRTYIENWLANWHESYLRLCDGYKISTVTALAEGKSIKVHEHFQTANFSFTYTYSTEDGRFVRIRYIISGYWIDFSDGDLPIEDDKKLDDKIEFTGDGQRSRATQENKLKQYAMLFYQKTEEYLKKTNNIILGDGIITKVIRMTADNLNQKEQIVLNKSALRSCELEDLLK
ncbi:MAG: nucleotidyl transferase AbiEii/AbiGii toxin family protein [Candidatus Sungbacteria bacterium]|nr:nucleotidyl transferase AbiEii/AbiGii toxin family protein [Candidatus Sungbacteria bacterium]